MKIFLIWVILFFSILNSNGQNHPVTIKNGFFYLNDHKFFIKGLGIEIVRPGQKLDSNESHDPEWFRYDAKRFLGAGYNTIRTWGAQTREQLEAVKDLDIKIIMGIWIPNHTDFSRTNFIDSCIQVVKDVLSYSKDYDNIIAYLIMNEPATEDLMKNYDITKKLYKTLVEEIHSLHPGTPVGMSAYPNISYLQMDMFDFIGYNVHPGTNAMQEYCYDYPSYLQYLKVTHGNEKPLIVTEYGVSASPKADSTRFSGSTPEERQANGLLYMSRSLVDGGAGGGCLYISSDGWYKDGDETTNNVNNLEEMSGLIAYQNLADKVGTPRPAWYTIKKYNSAVITSPKNGEVYQHKIPVEIFGSDTITHFVVKIEDSEVLTGSLSGNYYADTLTLDQAGVKDITLNFTFYDKTDHLVKEESVVCLTTSEALVLPSINISSDQQYIHGTDDITIHYSFINNDIFSTNGEIQYASDPVRSYDMTGTYKESIPTGKNYSFSKTYGTGYHSTPDIGAFTNAAVTVFSAGLDISYGNFKKRITGALTLWQDTAYNTIPSKIEAEECNFMSDFSNVLPYVAEDTNGDWAMKSTISGSWLKYYLKIPSSKKYKIRIRYSADSNSVITLKDGNLNYKIPLSATGDLKKWSSKDTSLLLPEGDQKVFVEFNGSNTGINWLEFSNLTGEKKLNETDRLEINPNPVTDNTFTIVLPTSILVDEIIKLKIFDTLGKECFTDNISDSGVTHFTIQLPQNFKSGLYLISIEGNNFSYGQKMVVQ